jgi:hypothetical protein
VCQESVIAHSDDYGVLVKAGHDDHGRKARINRCIYHCTNHRGGPVRQDLFWQSHPSRLARGKDH